MVRTMPRWCVARRYRCSALGKSPIRLRERPTVHACAVQGGEARYREACGVHEHEWLGCRCVGGGGTRAGPPSQALSVAGSKAVRCLMDALLAS